MIIPIVNMITDCSNQSSALTVILSYIISPGYWNQMYHIHFVASLSEYRKLNIGLFVGTLDDEEFIIASHFVLEHADNL